MPRRSRPFLRRRAPTVVNGVHGAPRTCVRTATARKIIRTLVVFVVAAGGAIWVGERLLPRQVGVDAPAFWLEGQSWWAPDYGRCTRCGGTLTPRVDELSACRHCPRCNVSFRHQSLPKTIEEMDRVWK
jgi:hypothetical protein